MGIHDGTATGASRPGVASTERLRFLLAAALAGVYFLLVLIMALFPSFLAATPFGGIISTGLIAALVMILLVFAVMGAFVRWNDARMPDPS